MLGAITWVSGLVDSRSQKRYPLACYTNQA